MSELYRGLLSSTGWYAVMPLSLLSLVALPLMFVVLAAFYVVVMPVAYLAYVAVSVSLLTIRDARW
jgi:hypothetical protein